MEPESVLHSNPAAPDLAPADRLPGLETFQDVWVGASKDRDTPGILWPDFETQLNARLWRYGNRVCVAPQISFDRLEIIEEPAVFVSMYDNHFGHMVSETVGRLPQTLTEGRGLPIYFTAKFPTTLDRTSAMFRSVLDWLDVPTQSVRFIHKPMLFRTVHIAAQAEHLGGPRPPMEYLHVLEGLVSKKIDWVKPWGITYVTRAAMPKEQGTQAGERYLVECLERLGVRVIYPERLTIHQQMTIYAQSQHLIFAEGSAVHGRQLIGRVDQHISILRRRFRSQIAVHQLTPRCASLTYVSCFNGAFYVRDVDGLKIGHAMSSLMNMDAVIAHFESLGVPLRQEFDASAFQKARDDDVLQWVAAMHHPKVLPWLRPHNPDEETLEQFEALGLGHLRDQAAAIIRQSRQPQDQTRS